MIRIIVDNLLIMGMAGAVVAILLIIVAHITKDRFSGTWHLSAWCFAMLTMVVPLYLVLSMTQIQLPIDQKATSNFRNSYLATMDDRMGGVFIQTTKTPENRESVVSTENPSNAQPAVANTQSATYAFSTSLRNVLLFVWAMGAVIISVYKVKRYQSIKQSILHASQESQSEWILLLPEKMRASVHLRECNTPTPIVFGYLRPIVVIPKDVENEEAIRYAMKYEFMHIMRRDHLWKFIAEMACVIQWFNPFAWIIKNKIYTYSEVACDEAIAEELPIEKRKEYVAAILDFIDHSIEPDSVFPAGVMSFFGDAESLRKRLKNIMRYKKMKIFTRILSICVVFMIMSIGLVTANEAGGLVTLKTSEKTSGKSTEKGPLELLGSYVTIGTEKYSFPMKYSDMEARGWTDIYYNVKTKEIVPEAGSGSTMEKDGKCISVMYYNYGNENVMLEDAYVVGVNSYKSKESLEYYPLALYNGITHGNTFEEVVAACGSDFSRFYVGDNDPDYSISYGELVGTKYPMYCILRFESATDKVVSLDYTCTDPEKTGITLAATSTPVPTPKPAPLAGPSGSTMTVDGITITLPIKYSDMEALGWGGNSWEDFETEEADGNCLYYTSLRKGDLSIGAILYNFGNSPILKADCYVVGISNYSSPGSTNTQAEVTLSNGLSLGRSYDEIVAAYGEPDRVEAFNGQQITYDGPGELNTMIGFDFDFTAVEYFTVYNLEPPH